MSFETYDDPFIDGFLKQQCLDTSGLYEWVKKRFLLDVNAGNLEIFVSDTEDYNQSSLSLSGAKYAKEWSVSSAIAGFGFDIVWTSGKIWSFLADDEPTCQKWVKGINKSIAISIQSLDKAVSESVAKSQDDLRALLRMPPANPNPAPKASSQTISTQQQLQQGFVKQDHKQGHLINHHQQQYLGTGTMAYPIQILAAGPAGPAGPLLPMPHGGPGTGSDVFTQKSTMPYNVTNPHTADPIYNQGLQFPMEKSAKGLSAKGFHSSDSSEGNSSHDTATEFQSPISYGQNVDPRHFVSGVQHTVPRYHDGAYRPPQEHTMAMNMGYNGQNISALGTSLSAIAAAESSNGSSPQGSEESKDIGRASSSPRALPNASLQLQQMFAMESGDQQQYPGYAGPRSGYEDAGAAAFTGSRTGPAYAGMMLPFAESKAEGALQPDYDVGRGNYPGATNTSSSMSPTRRGSHHLSGLPVDAMSPKRHASTASMGYAGTGGGTGGDDDIPGRVEGGHRDSNLDSKFGGVSISARDPNSGSNFGGSPRAVSAGSMNAMQAKLLEQVMEIEALKLRCKQLGADADREKADATAVRQQLSLMQQERDDAVAQVTQMTVSLKEKERLAVQAAQNELHTLVARAANESDALHEASLRAVREQHQREMSCLRDELTAERKRYGETMARETKLRDELDAREFELRREVATLRDQNARFSAEIARLQDSIKADAAAWQREKDAVVAAADARVAALQDERDKLVARAQTDQRLKISELTQRFDISVQDMETQIRDTVRQEMIADKLQEMAILQKRCANDVEAARQDERKLGQAALDELRRTYAERERQTTEDLSQLEKLHAGRVARLENQITVLKARAEAAEERMNETILELNRVNTETQRINEKHLQQLEEHAQKADALTSDLTQAHNEVQESRAREMSYREQLTRVLEESRVRHAELVELQRQVADRSAQASTWRKAASEIDITQANASTQLQIAAEEIAMLEHELQRVKQENSSLKKSLGSADRLVYGVFGSSGLSAERAAETDELVEMAKRAGRSAARTDAAVRPRSTSATRRASLTKGGLIKHPPWRNGNCNCSCKSSKCKCNGHGVAATTSSRPNSPGRLVPTFSRPSTAATSTTGSSTTTTTSRTSPSAMHTHKHAHTHHHTHTHHASPSKDSSPYPSVRYPLPRSDLR